MLGYGIRHILFFLGIPKISWNLRKKKDIAVSARLGTAYGSSIRSGGTPRTLLARLLVGLATGNPFW